MVWFSAARDKRPFEPCRHAALRVHASAETATHMISRRTDRSLVGQCDASQPSFVVSESAATRLLAH
ncbi:hypothetical protein DPMN_005296 [Dreissena polymorpha]|uniref:Uncharacterized protein n=1 Tax=Dreissena polymorpha TaxID=45954 RepID=A0A9D4RTS0_DREPO|nr:hypothetical protein DPMN_005296 [Dreissena polymorpha]